MKIFLKILIASLIAGLWYHMNGDESGFVAIALFIFVLFVLLVKPIEFQSPAQREDYIQQMKKKREQKLAIETKQKEEQLRLYKANQEREEKRKKELEIKLKNR
ncbi:hypothetical protein [Helicobacter cappadocius]|uniref:Uncharacterized protein n=1 Tax=Helicobacter cappadocius TaxID=3063998 RepID=A0AA90TC82_9HELI|nr:MULTISPECIES: hypothetical protein [unclassified Helicobacter]MDO7253613.1 hypothetical protein [Helicobacter sp. faydin-H75]MDP2539541.1 hypothetical protein [Helicobacter sp. faydin-H76]